MSTTNWQTLEAQANDARQHAATLTQQADEARCGYRARFQDSWLDRCSLDAGHDGEHEAGVQWVPPAA